jgi:hypothetical protein
MGGAGYDPDAVAPPTAERIPLRIIRDTEERPKRRRENDEERRHRVYLEIEAATEFFETGRRLKAVAAAKAALREADGLELPAAFDSALELLRAAVMPAAEVVEPVASDPLDAELAELVARARAEENLYRAAMVEFERVLEADRLRRRKALVLLLLNS